jgi:hypothetical protein
MFSRMGKMMLLLKIVVLVCFFGILYLLGVYSPLLQKYTAKVMNKSTEVVAGAHIVDTEKLNGKVPPLPEKIKTDINNSVETAKETGLDITVRDIFTTFGRIGKIVQDVRNLQDVANEKMAELAK